MNTVRHIFLVPAIAVTMMTMAKPSTYGDCVPAAATDNDP